MTIAKRFAPPALPVPSEAYVQQDQARLNNVLRLYFNQIDNLLQQLVTGFAASVPVTKVADFSVADTDKWLINNKSGSTCTATLPSAVAYAGRELHFQNYQAQLLVSASSNVVPLVGGAAGTSILTNVAGDTRTLVSDGSNWLITQ